MKSRSQKIAPVILLMVFGISYSDAGKTKPHKLSNKEKKIVSLLELTGSLNIGVQMGNAIAGQLASFWKSSGSGVSEEVIDLFGKRLAEKMVGEMKIGSPFVTGLIQIYSTHYSEKNVDDMIKFYKTETGKLVIQKMPTVVAESMAVGQKWGEEMGKKLAKEIIDELREEGYNLPEI